MKLKIPGKAFLKSESRISGFQDLKNAFPGIFNFTVGILVTTGNLQARPISKKLIHATFVGSRNRSGSCPGNTLIILKKGFTLRSTEFLPKYRCL